MPRGQCAERNRVPRYVTVLCPRCLESLDLPHPWDVGCRPPYLAGCPACGSPGELKVQRLPDGRWDDLYFELTKPASRETSFKAAD